MSAAGEGAGAAGSLGLERGAPVFLHQAFTCCPYAALVTARIHGYLERNGHPIVDHPEQAAAAVINTCGFNASRADRAEAAIDTVMRRNRGAPLVVTGCLTRIEPARFAEAASVAPAHALLGPHELERLDRLFGARVPFDAVRANRYLDRYSARDPRFGLYTVPVATGCRNECRYCVIRRAKGALRSRPVAEVVAEVQAAADAGERDVFLVADDLSVFGRDRDTDLLALLDALLAVDGVRFAAEAFEPSGLLPIADGLVARLRSGRFSWIVLPVQSGSDRVLRAMGRRYTVAEVEGLIDALRAADPALILSTDLIVGFPGERDDDLAASLGLARRFDLANFNEYEPRPGTPPTTLDAAQMAARMARVEDFLRQQGGQREALARCGLTPWVGERGASTPGARPPGRWAVDHAARLARRLGLPRALGEGWTAVAVEPRRDAAVVQLREDGGGRTLSLAASRRGAAGARMARTVEYDLALWSDAAIPGLDPGAAGAIDTLLAVLGADGASADGGGSDGAE